MLRIYFRLGSENRPTLEGAYMLAPNHTSYLDPILLGAVSFRRVTFMMTALHYRSPLMGWFYRWNKAIPVAVRKGNRKALRMAQEVRMGIVFKSLIPDVPFGISVMSISYTIGHSFMCMSIKRL